MWSYDKIWSYTVQAPTFEAEILTHLGIEKWPPTSEIRHHFSDMKIILHLIFQNENPNLEINYPQIFISHITSIFPRNLYIHRITISTDNHRLTDQLTNYWTSIAPTNKNPRPKTNHQPPTTYTGRQTTDDRKSTTRQLTTDDRRTTTDDPRPTTSTTND
jgi:hypothetical protein